MVSVSQSVRAAATDRAAERLVRRAVGQRCLQAAWLPRHRLRRTRITEGDLGRHGGCGGGGGVRAWATRQTSRGKCGRVAALIR